MFTRTTWAVLLSAVVACAVVSGDSSRPLDGVLIDNADAARGRTDARNWESSLTTASEPIEAPAFSTWARMVDAVVLAVGIVAMSDDDPTASANQ